ncbi:MAG TPA: hypothetical protein VFB63_12480 [Bryobacteraceae bacterium]|jgi:hypothetical protein|nr:hypothetical protein [Bryobacteraceae bacterium]
METFLRLILEFPANPVELACLWVVVLCAVVITSTLAYDSLAEL